VIERIDLDRSRSISIDLGVHRQAIWI